MHAITIRKNNLLGTTTMQDTIYSNRIKAIKESLKSAYDKSAYNTKEINSFDAKEVKELIDFNVKLTF